MDLSKGNKLKFVHLKQIKIVQLWLQPNLNNKHKNSLRRQNKKDQKSNKELFKLVVWLMS
jgi:hypothetical protein